MLFNYKIKILRCQKFQGLKFSRISRFTFEIKICDLIFEAMHLDFSIVMLTIILVHISITIEYMTGPEIIGLGLI